MGRPLAISFSVKNVQRAVSLSGTGEVVKPVLLLSCLNVGHQSTSSLLLLDVFSTNNILSLSFIIELIFLILITEYDKLTNKITIIIVTYFFLNNANHLSSKILELKSNILKSKSQSELFP